MLAHIFSGLCGHLECMGYLLEDVRYGNTTAGVQYYHTSGEFGCTMLQLYNAVYAGPDAQSVMPSGRLSRSAQQYKAG